MLESRCLLASGPSAALVADVVPGPGSSNPSSFTKVNDTIFFTTYTTSIEGAIWKTDGTAAGTSLVKALNFSPGNLTPMGGTLFFTENGSGPLWKSDGTAAGTVLVSTVPAFHLKAVNGKLLFSGYSSSGDELWVSDGTTAGTRLLKDIYSGSTRYCYTDRERNRICRTEINSSSPREMTDFNGAVYFTAADANGRSLWRTDGTATGTTLVKGTSKSAGYMDAGSLTVVNGTLYFLSRGSLWKSDGTSAGTVLLKTFTGVLDHLAGVNDTLFFTRSIDDGTPRTELWKSNGTSAGTVLVKSFVLEGNVPLASELTNAGGTLFFSAPTSSFGTELWKSDGTAAGTVLVEDIRPGSGNSFPLRLTNVNGLLYFTADDGVHGFELWQSDGSPAGTQLVRDIYAGATSSDPDFLTAIDNKLYFAATDPEHGREPWDPPAVAGAADAEDPAPDPASADAGTRAEGIPILVDSRLSEQAIVALLAADDRDPWGVSGLLNLRRKRR